MVTNVGKNPDVSIAIFTVGGKVEVELEIAAKAAIAGMAVVVVVAVAAVNRVLRMNIRFATAHRSYSRVKSGGDG